MLKFIAAKVIRNLSVIDFATKDVALGAYKSFEGLNWLAFRISIVCAMNCVSHSYT
jgi:hypothetical protein